MSSYIETADKREKADITTLNAEMAQTVEKINAPRTSIGAIINQIES